MSKVEMKLEVVVIPVSDVDRVVQFTPPDSQCSVRVLARAEG